MNTMEVPVLIVGGGPAGLTMSLLLSRHGVASLLVEKHAGPSPLPRARGIHARAMEILRVAGVEDDLRAAALPIHPGVEWRASLTAEPVREVSMSGLAAVEVSPCDGVSLAQDVLETILRDHAAASDHADLRYQTELRDLVVCDDRAEGVTLDRASGATTRVCARYLVAADGARSGNRQRLGIGMDGPAGLGRQRAVYFRGDLSAWTGPQPARPLLHQRGPRRPGLDPPRPPLGAQPARQRRRGRPAPAHRTRRRHPAARRGGAR